MGLTVREVMRGAVRTVLPSTRLVDLERDFAAARVGGFPVVEGTRLVGVVSRADIIRKAAAERSIQEAVSDYYRDYTHVGPEADRESDDQISAIVGRHLADATVSQVMAPAPIVVGPDAAIDEAARLFIEHRIHRIPVVDNDHLVGILTTTDLVELIADRRL